MRLGRALSVHPAMAILRGVGPGEVVGVAESIAAAGWRAIEVPLNRPGAVEAIARVAAALPEVAVGAGTLVARDQVTRVLDAGGTFAVSPHLDQELLAVCDGAGLDTMPGVLTPSEVYAASSLGRTHIKIFPLEALGLRGLRALGAVRPPGLVVTVVGGITTDSAAEVLDAGADAVGVASWLYRPGDGPHEVGRRAASLSSALAM